MPEQPQFNSDGSAESVTPFICSYNSTLHTELADVARAQGSEGLDARRRALLLSKQQVLMHARLSTLDCNSCITPTNPEGQGSVVEPADFKADAPLARPDGNPLCPNAEAINLALQQARSVRIDW